MNVFGTTICRLTTDGDSVPGTSGDDTINGLVSSTSDDTTFNPADVVNGGDGEDIFDLRMIGEQGNDVSSAGRSVENVETLRAETVFAGGPAASQAADINTGDFTDLEQVVVDRLRTDDGDDTGTERDVLTLSQLTSDQGVTFTAGSGGTHIVRLAGSPNNEVTFENSNFGILQMDTTGAGETVTLNSDGSSNSVALELGDTDLSVPAGTGVILSAQSTSVTIRARRRRWTSTAKVI